jgi:hypothetical protein
MQRHPLLTILMVLVGIILLLPGVCAAGFMITGGPLHLSDVLPWLGLWAICFLISAGGVILLYRAFRKPPAPTP